MPKTSETADLGQYKRVTTKTADHSLESTVASVMKRGGTGTLILVTTYCQGPAQGLTGTIAGVGRCMHRAGWYIKCLHSKI